MHRQTFCRPQTPFPSTASILSIALCRTCSAFHIRHSEPPLVQGFPQDRTRIHRLAAWLDLQLPLQVAPGGGGWNAVPPIQGLKECDIGFWHPGLHPLRPKGYDERLPYPGTGEAEWRGFLSRRTETPRVINPKQGWVANWNNVPSAGWTAGDAEALERSTGSYHRVAWLMQQVRRVKRRPGFDAAQAAIRKAGSVAQQRPGGIVLEFNRWRERDVLR